MNLSYELTNVVGGRPRTIIWLKENCSRLTIAICYLVNKRLIGGEIEQRINTGTGSKNT